METERFCAEKWAKFPVAGFDTYQRVDAVIAAQLGPTLKMLYNLKCL